MNRLMAIALAGALWGCDAKADVALPMLPPAADGPATTMTVKIDDV